MGLVGIIEATLTLLLAILPPSITAVDGGRLFEVTFDQGAGYACTIYQQQVVGEPDQNFPDGRYTPKHCWYLEPSDSGYQDDWAFIKPENTDWLVWSEIDYMNLEGVVVRTVLTNQVRVHR